MKLLIDHWNNEEINRGLQEILEEKMEAALSTILKTKLTEDELQLLREVVLRDRNETWDFFRRLLD